MVCEECGKWIPCANFLRKRKIVILLQYVFRSSENGVEGKGGGAYSTSSLMIVLLNRVLFGVLFLD
jgi:hypothetical protein